MDYAELIRRTPEWLYARNRDLLNTEMPNIVLQAHEQLINVIDHDFFRARVANLTLPTDGVLDLPTLIPRLLEVRAIRVQYRQAGEFTPLFQRDQEMLTMLYANNRPGRPRYYCEYDGPKIVKVYPQAPMAMNIEVTANIAPEPLSPTVANNVIGDLAPRAMEKATFRQAALFMKDQAAAATYEQEMMAAVVELNSSIGRGRRDETDVKPRTTANTTGS